MVMSNRLSPLASQGVLGSRISFRHCCSRYKVFAHRNVISTEWAALVAISDWPLPFVLLIVSETRYLPVGVDVQIR